MRPALLLAPFVFAACQPQTPAPAPAAPEEEAPAASIAPEAEESSALMGRVWANTDTAAAPGSIVVFLDGAVLQTSCVETYNLATWRTSGDGEGVMEENGVEIPVAYTLDGDALTLRLTLAGGETQESLYTPASVPTVCPDFR